MKVIGIFRNYDAIDAAILKMADLDIHSRNVFVSGFSDTDLKTEFGTELTFDNPHNVLSDRSDAITNDYNPMQNKLFAAGAALITATESTNTDINPLAPDGGSFEAVSLNAFTGDNKFSGKHYNKYIASFSCNNRTKASAIAQRLRNSGAENVVIQDA